MDSRRSKGSMRILVILMLCLVVGTAGLPSPIGYEKAGAVEQSGIVSAENRQVLVNSSASPVDHVNPYIGGTEYGGMFPV